jgi:SAM-dependent MidA family methyltransferase
MPCLRRDDQRARPVKTTYPEENLDLKEIIIERIRKQGRIPFSEFMEFCLYHPLHGYYQTGRERIGKRGDYFTSPSVHPVFGRLLAGQLSEMGDLLGEETFWAVEAGAGRGTLAADILQFLAEECPPFFTQVRYGIVERSASFRKEQKMRLAPYGERVAWLDLQNVQDEGLQGCFLANEFFDAFPIHRVLIKDGKLREIYVTEEDGVFRETAEEPSTEEIPAYLEDMDIRLEEGQQAEVNLGALKWYNHVARVLRRGFLLTIDYGYLAQDLYSPIRRTGTLLCYYRHTCSSDPYTHIGVQDMTTHVNFTGLIKKGESLGFQVTGFVPQYRFLLSLGFLDEMEKQETKDQAPEDSLMERLTMKHLILPDGGMGDTFKVLIQHKGIESVRLSGLRCL